MDHHSLNSFGGGKAVSSTNKNIISNCAEESGWTCYIDDLSQGIEPSYCSSLGGSSLVSDAASCAAWKFSHRNHGKGNTAPSLLKKLNLKKSRTKQISEDDTLKDTASSPDNSPKVTGFTSSENYSELQTHDEHDHEVNLNEKNIGFSDLRKRGLCVVPISVFVNYLG